MATYYVDMALGNDGNAGTSAGAGNAKKTLNGAEDIPLVPGDHVWVKASADYTEILALDVSGTSYLGAISYEGYTTTPGDGGQAIIDGASTRANCISMAAARPYRVFRNFVFKRSTSVAISGNNGSTCQVWDNIKFESVVGINLNAGSANKWIDCYSVTMSGQGFIFGSSSIGINCRVDGSNAIGLACFAMSANTVMYNCTFRARTNSDYGVSCSLTGTNTFVNCIFDGAGFTGVRGLFYSGSPTTSRLHIINCIFMRLNEGIRGGTTLDNSAACNLRTNIFSDVTTKYANGWGADTKSSHLAPAEINVTPTFVDLAGGDYTPLDATSPQLQVGVDNAFDGTSGMDIGAIQKGAFAGGGGGGLLMPIGTTGGTS